MYSWYSAAQRLHARLAAQIGLAVGQAEPALQQEGDVVRLAVVAHLHREAEQVRGVVDAPVERVDVGAQACCPATGPAPSGPSLPSMRASEAASGAEAAHFDGRLVQVGRAEIGDLARESSRHGGGVRVVEQPRDLRGG